MTEYQAALREFRSATAAFNLAGEPSAGPVVDRLDAARDRFIRAQTPEPETAAEPSASRPATMSR